MLKRCQKKPKPRSMSQEGRETSSNFYLCELSLLGRRARSSSVTTNTQIHFAHRERNDNRHSPQDVLRGVLARILPAPTLARIFFAIEFTRHMDRSGYIHFRRWRFYAEVGLLNRKFRSASSPARSRLNIKRQSWLSTRWNGRITNASKR